MARLKLHVEVLGVEPGAWCSCCALPSALILTVAIGGSTVGRWAVCTECRCRGRPEDVDRTLDGPG